MGQLKGANNHSFWLCETILQKGLLLKERTCFKESKFSPLREAPFEWGILYR